MKIHTSRALLLPVEAVASAEPTKALAGTTSNHPADGTARYRNRARSQRAASDTAAGGVQLVNGVQMTGWSQVR